MPAMTRGPLPAGIYWRRRLFIGLLALSVAFIVATSLGAGSDGSSEEAVARPAGAEPTATVTMPSDSRAEGEVAGEASPTAEQPERKQKRRLAEPSGACAAGDVVVTPVTERAVAGQPVRLTLSLQTRTTPACHWRVGPQRLAVRISGAGEEVWSTRHCAEGVPAKRLVVRRTVATELTVTWDARESEPGCPEATEWVLPGEYVVSAAALGGEPREQALRLVAPTAQDGAPEHRAEQKSGNALQRIQQRQR